MTAMDSTAARAGRKFHEEEQAFKLRQQKKQRRAEMLAGWLAFFSCCVVLGIVGFVTAWVTARVTSVKVEWKQAVQCLAQASSFEGNVLDAHGEALIDQVVLNRARQVAAPASFLLKVCYATGETHVNKKLERPMRDFSGLNGHTPFEDDSSRDGWGDSVATAEKALRREILGRYLPAFFRPELGAEYLYYHSQQIPDASFARANGVVCDAEYASGRYLVRFCKKKAIANL